MTLYKESLKRLSKLGIILLALVVIVSTVMTVQYCMDEVKNDRTLTSAYCFDQCLIAFMYIGGIGFACLGFSFLVRRSDSDFYHSLPISRRDLYLSITMAAATWIAATVFLSILCATVAHLAIGRSFVPMYPLMNFVFYLAGTLLVFSAAAIAMSVTGTWFSTAIVTGLVLFLPRYILFIAARAVAGKTMGLTNWVDFGVLLNPAYNAAVAPIALLFRPTLQYNVMRFSCGFYSLFVAMIELTVGCFLFIRRKSEIAEHGATNRAVQTAFACLAALPLLLLVASGRLYGSGNTAFLGVSAGPIIITVLSAGVYIAYQMIVLKSFHDMLRSLPWYLASFLVSAGIVAAAGAYGTACERFMPTIDGVESVQFLSLERNEYATNTYRSLMTSKIRFTDADTIDCAVKNYANTRAYASEGQYYYGYYTNNYDVVTRIPVRFYMKDGTSKVRNVLFANKTALETLRRRNADYVAALGSFAPAENICGRTAEYNTNLTDADIEEIRVSYEKEFPQDTLKAGAPAYALAVLPNETIALTDKSAPYGTFHTYGYVGMERYIDSCVIVPDMQKTCSLWMQRCNLRADTNGYDQLMLHITDALSDTALEWSSLNLRIKTFNLPISDRPNEHQASMNLSVYGGNSSYQPEAQAILLETAKLLSRGTPTDDPTALTVQASYWYEPDYEVRDLLESPKFLVFDEATNQRLIELFNHWYALMRTPELMYNYY